MEIAFFVTIVAVAFTAAFSVGIGLSLLMKR